MICERILGAQESLPAWLLVLSEKRSSRSRKAAGRDACAPRVLASPEDRLLELRIELESQTAFRARQNDSNSSCRSRDRAFKQSRNSPGEKNQEEPS